jgi:uncharacterized membrane protein
VNLLRGLPGHPLHPPLTDATIGIYTGATAFAVLSVLGVAERSMSIAWWLALFLGLVFTVPTALTGLLDWLQISRGTELWKTATAHLASMVSATVFFLLAAIVGHSGYVDREVAGAALVLTLIGFGLLTLGGWLGGTIVFVHGMRVLNLVEEPVERAVAPHPEREGAASGSEETRGQG